MVDSKRCESTLLNRDENLNDAIPTLPEEALSNRESCYICLEAGDAATQLYACNCSSFVHRSCLSRWIADGHAQCAVCGLLYDENRRNDRCFLCKKVCRDSFIPCKCRHVTVHRNCLARACESGTAECPFCSHRYAIVRERQFNFAPKRCLYILTCLMTVALVAFLIAPLDFLASITNHVLKQTFVYRNDTYDGEHEVSFLFPGSRREWVLASVALFVALPLFMLFGCAYLGHVLFQVREKMQERNWKFSAHAAICTIPAVAVVVMLILHLFGNVHYQFYCVIGVIPSENCFWLFNWASFVAAPSGIAHVCLAVNCIRIAFRLLRRMFLAPDRVAVLPYQ